MRHRSEGFEKMSRALQLHEQGVETAAIAGRLGISSREAARTIAQAKARRTRSQVEGIPASVGSPTAVDK